MAWADVPVSINAVLANKLYIGNLSAALSQDVRKTLGITHLLTVCKEHTLDPQSNTMVIPVLDSEYEDLLIHLPDAVLFIETALGRGGKVLVHCMMGVSRSATVICAYLMVSQRMSVSAAVQYLRKCRPEIHPNYGFMKQLHAFSLCRYKPSCTNIEYIAWKRRQKRDVAKYLNLLTDCIPVVPDQLYLTSEFPGDADAAESLLLDLGVTHLLSISSAQLPVPNPPSLVQHSFVDVPNNAREALLLALPSVCSFIRDAISCGGHVLVQCRVELRACIVACAYLMISRNISPRQAYSILEIALPLYNPTSLFYRHLELFAACNYRPTIDHPLVHAWLTEQSGSTAVKASTTKAQSTTKTNSIPASLPAQLTIRKPATLSTDFNAFDMISLQDALPRCQVTSPVGS